MPRLPTLESIDSVLQANVPPSWTSYHIDADHPIYFNPDWQPQSASELHLLDIVNRRAGAERPDGRHSIVMMKRLKNHAKVTFIQVRDAELRRVKVNDEVEAAKTLLREVVAPVAIEFTSSWSVIQEIKRRLDLQKVLDEKEKELENREARCMGRIARFQKFKNLLIGAGEWEEVATELEMCLERDMSVGSTVVPSPAVVATVNSSPAAPLLNAVQKAIRPPLLRRNAGPWIVSLNI
ncbi:hypothetical protein BKA65DRAFT_486178 [Rhexocercosporidium sp. MPI-PUGE-AT-0058]|nr:hypothetical protein BKA65DRAFT_486178 [Rhexocercosporidium sp. MPI-PUGE-AT-0058]